MGRTRKKLYGQSFALTSDLMCACRRARHQLCIPSPRLTHSGGDTDLVLAEGVGVFYFLTALEPQNQDQGNHSTAVHSLSIL